MVYDEQLKAKKRAYYLENREKKIEYARAYYHTNAASIMEKQRAYKLRKKGRINLPTESLEKLAASTMQESQEVTTTNDA